jgi:hypothetical protein
MGKKKTKTLSEDDSVELFCHKYYLEIVRFSQKKSKKKLSVLWSSFLKIGADIEYLVILFKQHSQVQYCPPVLLKL